MTHSKSLHQFLRFAAVGLSGTAVQYLTFFIAVETHFSVFAKSPAVTGSAIGYLLGSVVNYILNYFFTFGSEKTHFEAATKYFTVLLVGWCLNFGLMTLFVEQWGWFGLWLWAGQILSTGVVLCWNFAGSKLWAFKQKKIEAHAPEMPQQTAQNDPLYGVKKGGKVLASKLFAAMSTEKGIHLESLLCALGSLAGYACQASVREEFIRQQGKAEKDVFIVINSKLNGEVYYFGDQLNKPLAESRYSVWSLSSGAAQKMGLTELTNLHDIFKYATDTLGSAEFGIPRVPSVHQAHEKPRDYVHFLWPKLFPLAQTFCQNPSEWPMLFGVAIQEIFYASEGLIEMEMALRIVMESAIPMSKIQLRNLDVA